MNILSVKDLEKNYDPFHLGPISFELEQGTITGFIGRNGAGKSTTIKSMLNLIHPDNGSIHFFDIDLKGNEAAIKNRIGYSSGTVNWYPHNKISDIASITKMFYHSWDEAAYRKWLDLFQIDENKTPSQLSEGMKVKCNLMIALSHRAELLILDEPTSGLDPFSRDELIQTFRKLKDEGITIFFSTHITSDIEKCANNILYISKGSIKTFLPREDFISAFALPGESFEDTFLRLERGVSI